MAKVIGSVDVRGRPVVRIEGKDDSILVVVDTGFNGDLMLTREASRLLGVDPGHAKTDVELGDGRRAAVYEARVTIKWLGSDRQVRILVADDWKTTGDAPVGLLGTALLSPHLLIIDFSAGTVEISNP